MNIIREVLFYDDEWVVTKEYFIPFRARFFQVAVVNPTPFLLRWNLVFNSNLMKLNWIGIIRFPNGFICDFLNLACVIKIRNFLIKILLYISLNDLVIIFNHTNYDLPKKTKTNFRLIQDKYQHVKYLLIFPIYVDRKLMF